MRIDEFSAPSDIDGVMGTKEQRRFLLFGFDIQSVIPLYGDIFIDSPLCVEKIIHTPLNLETLFYSNILTQMSIDSLITTTIILD